MAIFTTGWINYFGLPGSGIFTFHVVGFLCAEATAESHDDASAHAYVDVIPVAYLRLDDHS
jgi:hypothetical protein